MKIKVLSWNIWCDGDLEGQKELLKESDPEIICLQEVIEEVTPNISDYLNELGYKHVYAKSGISLEREGRAVYMGNGIYTKFEILKSRVHLLSEKEGRIALQADIALEGKTLYVFSAHLTHDDLKPSLERERQVDEIIEVLPKEHVLLMGDFNTLPESIEIEKISQVLENTDSTLTPTWSNYPEGCPKCLPKGVNQRLDYIFASKDIKVISSKVEESKASDHLPVSAIVEI